MLEIAYERTFVAKSYFSLGIVFIRPTDCEGLVLQQCCAHTLNLGLITPTPEFLQC